jgi:hypothetical protein
MPSQKCCNAYINFVFKSSRVTNTGNGKNVGAVQWAKLGPRQFRLSRLRVCGAEESLAAVNNLNMYS